jgi:hypothetical protein
MMARTEDSWRATHDTTTQAKPRRGFAFAGETESRPGIMTTEYWLAILSAATVVIAGYFSDALPERVAWPLFAGIIAAYVLSRGFAKAGSREGPFVFTGEREAEGRSRDSLR